MDILLQWIYFIFLISILCIPTFLMFQAKNIYFNIIETLVKSFYIGFFQFFLTGLVVFLCKIPVNLWGWGLVYLIHISITFVLWNSIKNHDKANKMEFFVIKGKTFWLFICLISIVLILYLFQTIRKTEIIGDSCFFWFVKGWTFYNTHDIYIFQFLHGNSYPLLIPLIYNFFIQMNCGLGIASYSGLLFLGAILLTLTEGWTKTGKYSVVLGIPICVFLPILFREHIYESYADIPLSFVYYMSLLTISDTLFERRSSYPAMILLCVIPMIKSNGQYLFLLCFFISVVFMFVRDTKINKHIPMLSRLFGLSFGLIIVNKAIMMLLNVESWITKIPLEVLKNEIIHTTNPFLSYWNKLIPSIKYFFELTTSVPSFSIFLMPLIALSIFSLLKTRERFLLFNVFSVIFFTVCVIYVMIENAWRKWWYDTGYWRMLVVTAPSIVGFLYFSTNEFLYKLIKSFKITA